MFHINIKQTVLARKETFRIIIEILQLSNTSHKSVPYKEFWSLFQGASPKSALNEKYLVIYDTELRGLRLISCYALQGLF